MTALSYGLAGAPPKLQSKPLSAARVARLTAGGDHQKLQQLQSARQLDAFRGMVNNADPNLIALNRQATEDRADIELRAQEEQAADAREAAASQNQLALAMATRRRAPGGGFVMGNGMTCGGMAVGRAGGGLSRANAEVLKKARLKNIDAKVGARTDEIYKTQYATPNQLAGAAQSYQAAHRSPSPLEKRWARIQQTYARRYGFA